MLAVFLPRGILLVDLLDGDQVGSDSPPAIEVDEPLVNQILCPEPSYRPSGRCARRCRRRRATRLVGLALGWVRKLKLVGQRVGRRVVPDRAVPVDLDLGGRRRAGG